MKEPRLEDLKTEYDSIPVPAELEFLVRSSIAQAKEESKKELTFSMKVTKTLKTTGIAACAAMLTIVVLANSTAGIAHAMEQIPVLGAITRVVTFRTFEENNGNSIANVAIPKVEGGSQELNKAIEEYTNAIIAEYEEAAKAVQAYDESGAPTAETNHYEVDLSYKTVTDNDKLFALRFDQLVVMAGGNQMVQIYTVDKATGKIVTLGDLFAADSDYLTAISDSIKEQMAQRMADDDTLYYWLNDEIEAFNFQSITDETAFFVDSNGKLNIVFNEGDVAPMYMGVCEFVIPTEALSDIALPGYFQ